MNLQLGVVKEAGNGFWMELCSNVALSEGNIEHSESVVGQERDQLACFLWDLLKIVKGAQTIKINGDSLTIWREALTVPWKDIIPEGEEWTRRYCVATGRI